MKERVEQAIEKHEAAVRALSGESALLVEMAERLVSCVRDGGRIYVLGNGGSAADAQHIAAELVGKYRRDRRGFPAVALTTDTSLLTAVSNDYGFEAVFERQVEALVGAGDVVWVLSTSGNSENVLRAAERAKQAGAVVMGFTGGSGGKLKERCDLCLVVGAQTSDRIQEVHQLAYHVICEMVEEALSS